MKRLLIVTLLGSAAAVTGCETAPAPAPAVAVAAAGDVCGTYGYVDANNDGFISGDEWNTYRTTTFPYWDVNHDGRIDRSEFENCYRAGGFYRSSYYNPDLWTRYWTGFDANGDGWLTPDEYWSTRAWSSLDRNGNGRIDSDEWWR